MSDVVGPEDRVDPWRSLDHRFPVFLGQATADGDLHTRPAQFQRPELTEVAVQAVIRVLTYAARVENDDISNFSVIGRDQALSFQQARQPLGVVLVHLAAERTHQVPARLPRRVFGWPVLAVRAHR